MFHRDTRQTIDFPSGEICGSDTVTIFAKSAASILRDCAFVDATAKKAIAIKHINVLDFMV
jgi:hypothetical protein